jgi:4'-phosphopantetheinyl transferase
MRANSICHDEVQVWRVGLDRTAAELDRLYALLSPDERHRAWRFAFAQHRNRYVAARGALRLILSQHTGEAPERLRFEYEANGKPFLAGHSVRFNLSHSGRIAIVAVTCGREIGVDVEQIRRDGDLLDVAELYFAPEERAALRSLAERDRCYGFFRCWTRKEAYLKARGDGLSMDLHGFVVSLEPGRPAALLNSVEGPAEVARWGLAELHPTPGYAAAVAVEGANFHVMPWKELAI